MFPKGGESFAERLPSIYDGNKQHRTARSQRVMGCAVFPATEIIEPGMIRHENGNNFPIDERDGKRMRRVESIHDNLVAAKFDAPIRDNIRD
jgi:2-dehydropantoate 2-reductase